LEFAVFGNTFDKYKKAEVTRVPTETGPDGFGYQITQGDLSHGEVIPANRYEEARQKAGDINDELLARNPRRMAVLAGVAGTALVATVAAGGFALAESGGNASHGSQSANAPAPTETKLVTSTATEFVTETPDPVIKTKIRRVKVTVTPKPHHGHKNASHEVSNHDTHEHTTPEAPYTPPPAPTSADTPEPAPAAKPTHHSAPHLTVHHLNEHK
jgi:hypothetical protein